VGRVVLSRVRISRFHKNRKCIFVPSSICGERAVGGRGLTLSRLTRECYILRHLFGSLCASSRLLYLPSLCSPVHSLHRIFSLFAASLEKPYITTKKWYDSTVPFSCLCFLLVQGSRCVHIFILIHHCFALFMVLTKYLGYHR
jgi:hypothetical protein